MNIWMTLIIFAIITVYFLVTGIKILEPNQIGIKLLFGSAKNKKGLGPGGIYFIFWPIQKLKIFTNEVMVFEFTTPSIITRRGGVQGYADGVVEPTEIDIKCTMNAKFDINKLHRAAENTSATNGKDLGPLIVPYVIDVIRTLGSRIPWRLMNQERHYAADWIIARLISGDYKRIDLPVQKKDGDSKNKDDVYGQVNPNDYETGTITIKDVENESPFLQFGLTNVTLAIENIDFTDKEMDEVVFAGEKARLKATATKLNADAERYRREQEGIGSANARNSMLAVVKEAGSNLEALFTLREMAQGSSNTMMYQIPEGLTKTLSTVLGGNSLESMLGKLSATDRKSILAQIEKAIKGQGE